jgi:hypothetical protein
MLATNSIVAVYDTQTDVEMAVRDLQQAAFDLRRLSVFGREQESGEHVLGYYNIDGNMRYCGDRGSFWNDLWKQFEGAGHFAIPGLGRVLSAGPLTVSVVQAVRSPSADGLSAVGAGLCALNIPKASILRYESALKMHKLLLIAEGSTREVLNCKDVLRESQPRETNIHFAAEGVQSAV